MLPDELKYDLTHLPWRGPVIPVESDAADSMLPTKRGLVRVRVFDLGNDQDQEAYSRITNRIDQGLAELRASQINTTPDGGFRALLVWAELYMCAPGFVPEEGRPVLRTLDGVKAQIDDGGYGDASDDESRLREAMQAWASHQLPETPKENPSIFAEPAETSVPLVYTEDEGETQSLSQPQSEPQKDPR